MLMENPDFQDEKPKFASLENYPYQPEQNAAYLILKYLDRKIDFPEKVKPIDKKVEEVCGSINALMEYYNRETKLNNPENVKKYLQELEPKKRELFDKLKSHFPINGKKYSQSVFNQLLLEDVPDFLTNYGIVVEPGFNINWEKFGQKKIINSEISIIFSKINHTEEREVKCLDNKVNKFRVNYSENIFSLDHSRGAAGARNGYILIHQDLANKTYDNFCRDRRNSIKAKNSVLNRDSVIDLLKQHSMNDIVSNTGRCALINLERELENVSITRDDCLQNIINHEAGHLTDKYDQIELREQLKVNKAKEFCRTEIEIATQAEIGAFLNELHAPDGKKKFLPIFMMFLNQVQKYQSERHSFAYDWILNNLAQKIFDNQEEFFTKKYGMKELIQEKRNPLLMYFIAAMLPQLINKPTRFNQIIQEISHQERKIDARVVL
jgi:hypothetical protein